MSIYEQYLYRVIYWAQKFNLSFSEIEKMPLDLLFDFEIVESKIDAAFQDKKDKVFIDDIF